VNQVFKEEITDVECIADLTVDLREAFLQYQVSGNFESSGVKATERQNPETPLDKSPRSWPEIVWSDGEELRQRMKALMLVIEGDLCGLKASGLTLRSREHLLEHSWVSGLISISIEVVNIENGGGG
jgi:hypothetical protein